MQRTETVEVTKASSKGQVVIPTGIRKKLGIKKGSLFIVSSSDSMIVMRKMAAGMSKEDLRTLKKIGEAWKNIEQRRYKVYSKDAFSKELAKW